MNNRARISTAGFLVLAAAWGCGEPNPLGRKEISGEVIYDGSPLEAGLIELTPKDPNGVSTGTVISAGRYSIAAHQGVPPGDYTVRITSPVDGQGVEESVEPAPPGPQEGGPRQPPPATERIPADYNTRSNQLVTVTKEGPNRFDFDIPAAKVRRSR